MHLPTLFLGRWMHPPTQIIFFESADASADPKIESVDAFTNPKRESVDASTDPKTGSVDASADFIF